MNFEKDKMLKKIKEKGISSTEQGIRQKMRYLIEDMITNTQYRRGTIIDKIIEIADDYFDGLPIDIAEKEVSAIYDEISAKIKKDENKEKADEHKIITIYESEMKTIKSLRDDSLMRLAFATLIYHKYQGQYQSINGTRCYTSFIPCQEDILKTAGIDNCSGSTVNKMWRKLSDAGLIKWAVKTNPVFRFNPAWTAMQTITVCFNVDILKDKSNETVYQQISNYDDVMAYLLLYLGDKSIIQCYNCGYPLRKKVKSKCLCPECAAKQKKNHVNKIIDANLGKIEPQNQTILL